MKYRPEIDGLRALAVLPVIFFHAGFQSFSGGYVGVDIFFVISGYLITTIIISEMAENKFSIVNFYERRARRILPALFFVMMICVPFAYFWFAPSDLKVFGQSLLAVSTFWSNILLWKKSGYFEFDSELNPLLHTWSLSVEEQFYLLFPIFLVLVWRLGPKLVLLLLSIIFLLSLSIANYGAFNHPSATFFFLPTRGWELLIGSFAAFYLKYKSHFQSKFINESFSILGFMMVIFSIIFYDESTPFPSIYALVPTIGTLFMIIMVTPETMIYRLLSLNPLVGFGLISYSSYLWHQPLFAFAKYRYFEDISNNIMIILCLFSILLAWLTWRFIERPFRDKSRLNRKWVFQASIASILIFSLIGHWFNLSNGHISKYSSEDQTIFKSFFDPSSYLVKRREQMRLRKFDSESGNKKVLIIGDSHSEDLLNALFESGLGYQLELSSYYISNSCGVLLVDHKEDREVGKFRCEGWKDLDKEFFNLASYADEIWVVSSWRYLDVRYMRESISNLKSLNEKVIVFGKKDFGIIRAGFYKKFPKHRWAEVIDGNKAELNKSNANLNKLIQAEVLAGGAEFIDLQDLTCDGLDVCPNYVEGGIISYDGSHLTPFGALFIGNKIKDQLEKNLD